MINNKSSQKCFISWSQLNKSRVQTNYYECIIIEVSIDLSKQVIKSIKYDKMKHDLQVKPFAQKYEWEIMTWAHC